MSWKDYINLDGIFDDKKPRQGGVWGALQDDVLDDKKNPLSLEGIRGASDAPITNLVGNRKLDVEGINAQFQERNRGFSVIDVNPRILFSSGSANASQFLCQIPQNTLIQKVGAEVIFAATAPRFVTVPINVPGNFLKIDFKTSAFNTVPTTVPAQSVDSFGKTTYPPATISSGENNGSPAVIMLQFDDSGSPVVIVNDGDTFRLDFTQVFISFSSNFAVPDFVVTVGQDCVISNERQTPIDASALAVFPGHGLFENALRHCTPFTFDQNDNQTAYNATPNPISLAAGTEFNAILINQNLNPANRGISRIQGYVVGWITQVTVVGRLPLPANMSAGFGIYQGAMDAVPLRQLVYVPMQAGPTDSVSGFTSFAVTLSFPQPVRFCFNGSRNHMLQVSVVNSGGSILNFAFAIHGYIWGSLSRTTGYVAGGFNWQAEALLNSPFPCDESYTQWNK